MLVEKLREQKQYDRAEQLLAGLHKEFPDESNLAAALVQIVSLQAVGGGARGQSERQRQLQDRAASMIREYRARYPKVASFLQAECDMAARRGDFTQAIALTREIDEVAKTSTLGPLLRVRLFAMLGRPEEVARAYGEAVDRERGDRQLDYRVLLGQVRLRMGDADEAIRQAGHGPGRRKKRLDAADPPGARPGPIGGDAQREGGPAPRRPWPSSTRSSRTTPTCRRRLSGPGRRPPGGRRACRGPRRVQR